MGIEFIQWLDAHVAHHISVWVELGIATLCVVFFLFYIWRMKKREPMLWDTAANFFAASILGVFVVMVCLYLSPIFMGEDSWSLYRYLTIRLASFSLALLLLTSGVMFWDFVTPGNTLEAIHKAPYGPVIVISVVVFALGLILAFA